METPAKQPLFCPRCDRKFLVTSDGVKNQWERLKYHVAHQHPDHDPEWFDTYPHEAKEKSNGFTT